MRVMIVPPKEIPLPLGDGYGGIERKAEDLYNHLRSLGVQARLFDWGRGGDPNARPTITRSAQFELSSGEFLVIDLSHMKDAAPFVDSGHYLAYSFATDRISFRRDALATRAVKEWFMRVMPSDVAQGATSPRDYVASLPVVYPGIANAYAPARSREGYALFLGRIAPYKGVHVAIDAAAEAGVRLVIAGHTGAFADRAYVERIRRYAANKGMRFIGDVTAREKADLLARACCLIAPSDWSSLPGSPPESFGIVVVEALLSGAPAIVPARSGMAEIVGDSGAGIVVDDPGGGDWARARAYAAALRRLASDPPDPERCVERGLYFTVGRFWEDIRRVTGWRGPARA